MKNANVLKTILFISGLIGAGVGGAILCIPVAFYASNGIELGGDISLLSDIRGAGGALLACGLFIMSGAFVAKLRFTAAVISVLLYLSYGTSRILGMALDGMPVGELVGVAVLEISIGLLGVFVLINIGKIANKNSF